MSGWTLEEEDDKEERELLRHVADGLELVPLICYENGAPEADEGDFVVLLSDKPWRMRAQDGGDVHFWTGLLPVDEEDVNITLQEEAVEEVQELGGNGDGDDQNEVTGLIFDGEEDENVLLGLEEEPPVAGHDKEEPEEAVSEDAKACEEGMIYDLEACQAKESGEGTLEGAEMRLKRYI